MFLLQMLDRVGRLLDLCIKSFQEFVTWLYLKENGSFTTTSVEFILLDKITFE